MNRGEPYLIRAQDLQDPKLLLPWKLYTLPEIAGRTMRPLKIFWETIVMNRTAVSNPAISSVRVVWWISQARRPSLRGCFTKSFGCSNPTAKLSLGSCKQTTSTTSGCLSTPQNRWVSYEMFGCFAELALISQQLRTLQMSATLGFRIRGFQVDEWNQHFGKLLNHNFWPMTHAMQKLYKRNI